ncbi:MAG TPA: site-2 protease family protein [Vicinamibacteria bacterium]
MLLFSLSVHESAHALAALKMGDDTAEREGRITLNPLAHIDPLGTVLFPLMQMFTGLPFLGWAKPTPYNPANFSKHVSLRQGHIVVAAAGPVSNLLLALVFTAVFWVLVRTAEAPDPYQPLFRIAAAGIQMNVVLALFNLVPIPPLDGSKVASFGLSPRLGDQYDRIMGPYGYLILLVLLVSGVIGWILSPITQWVLLILYRLALA